LTVQEALGWAVGILKEKNIETPVKEAGVLLAFVLSKDVSWLYAHPQAMLSPVEEKKFRGIVVKRAEGMPFQYISHKQEFMSLEFYVDSNCLIPRADTEILVEAALAWIREHPMMPMRILDIGTGSGAIAVSIAHYCPDAEIDAMDLSGSALAVAEENARRHQALNRIRFIRGDFLVWEPQVLYSLIVSNPPYIPRNELDDLMPAVRDYEPRMALDGGEDGLLFYRAIALKAQRLLMPGGAVFTEVGIHQAGQVSCLYEKQGLMVRVFKDLSGIDRVVSGEKTGKYS
jgi:release factor glutamine methyltransferase